LEAREGVLGIDLVDDRRRVGGAAGAQQRRERERREHARAGEGHCPASRRSNRVLEPPGGLRLPSNGTLPGCDVSHVGLLMRMVATGRDRPDTVDFMQATNGGATDRQRMRALPLALRAATDETVPLPAIVEAPDPWPHPRSPSTTTPPAAPRAPRWA